jgi:thiol-disulfide isomerase/thioredoxin
MNVTLGSIQFRFFLLLAMGLPSLSFSNQAVAQELKWQTDLEQAVADAKRENKFVLLHFTATWSKSCKEIDTFVFSNPQVKRAIKTNVIPVRLDVDEHPELTAQYGVANVPYDVVITPSRGIVVRRNSPKEAENYALAIQRLEKKIQQFAGKGASRFDQNLNDFQQIMLQHADAGRDQAGLAPDLPAHQGAPPSQESQELFRKSNQNQTSAMVQNPLVNAARPSVTESQATAATATRPTPSKPTLIVNPNVPRKEAADNRYNSLVAATMQPNLQRPPHSNQASGSERKDESLGFLPNPSAQLAGFSMIDGSSSNLSIAPKAMLDAPDSDMKDSGDSVAMASPIALKGKCPITLIQQGRWQDGSKQWGCIHRSQTYLFASEANLNTFLTDPDAYSPLLAGYDPVVFADSGQLVAGSIENGVFMGQSPNLRIVLFRDGQTRTTFEADPRKYLRVIQQALDKTGGRSSSIR